MLSLAFAPFGIWPLAILVPALLFYLWRGVTPARAAVLGFAFGVGCFTAGTYWLYISIVGFGQAPVWLAIVLMLALVAVMALYSALLGYLAARFLPADRPWASLLALPAGWVLLEWIRGWFLSGFGWLSLGYAHTDNWLAGFAPIGGVYLLSWLTALLSMALLIVMQGSRRSRWAALAILLLPWPIGAALDRLEWTRMAGAPVRVAIVQGAVPQDRKWQEDNREATLQLYRDLTIDALGTPLVVWPEAALPELANRLVPFLGALGSAARSAQTDLLLGLIRAEPTQLDEQGNPAIFNSLLSLGETVHWYDKQHLVPFGEFFPVPPFVRRWMRLMSLPYSDFTAGVSNQPPLKAGGLVLAASICYEDAYPTSGHRAVRQSTALVNVTNDAWFGRSTARFQHLQISRLRAIESRRFLLRAANDGVSAIIGPRGELLATAPEYQSAVLRGEVEPRTGAPPYVVVGNLPVLLAALLSLLLGLFAVRTGRETDGELPPPEKV